MRNDLTKFKGFRSFESLKQQMVNIVQFRQTLKKKDAQQQRTTKEGCGNTFQWTNHPHQPENTQKLLTFTLVQSNCLLR